jgi:peptide/nickel transport system substrate-binding protein
MATFLQRSDARDFDGAMMALHLDGNPGSIKQTWSAAEAAKPNGSNYASYVNPLFDAQVDSALALYSPDETRAAFSKAMRTLLADVPAIWLYDLKSVVGVHKRIRLAPLRPDAWWAHLSEWSIPANERIARDAPISVARQ